MLIFFTNILLLQVFIFFIIKFNMYCSLFKKLPNIYKGGQRQAIL